VKLSNWKTIQRWCRIHIGSLAPACALCAGWGRCRACRSCGWLLHWRPPVNHACAFTLTVGWAAWFALVSSVLQPGVVLFQATTQNLKWQEASWKEALEDKKSLWMFPADCSPLCNLIFHHLGLLHLHNCKTIINHCYSKLLNLGMFCYVAIGDWNKGHLA
jgi:hypothetical protein